VFGYLDLYDATGENKYMEAALRAARTYLKIRREDGTWPLVVNRHTGEVLKSKPVIPTWVLFFFERLHKQYRLTEFAEAAEQIAAWILAHPAEGFHWDSQFEDVKIKEPYRKMAYEQAADTAYYLLSNYPDDEEKVRLAEELLRYVEDQFIVWEKPTDGWKTLGLPGGPTKYAQYAVDTWIAPAVIEQYGFVLVARATAVVMRVYAKAYEVTGREVYLAKAKSLANTLVVTQQYHGGGEIPSFPMTSQQIIWTNNSVYTALFLLELGEKHDS
jgi:maltose/maltodextrin transport system substrate-binding protein